MEVRLETLQCESGKADTPPERYYHWGARDGRETFVDPSWLQTHHPTSSVPHSAAPFAPSSKYMQALPVPVVPHPLLAKIGEPDIEPYAGAVRVPPEWEDLYHEIPSTTVGSHILPSALHASHPLVYGAASED